MFDFLIQLLGLLLLFGGVAFGYWRWIHPHKTILTAQSRGLLLLIVLTLMGGFIGSPFWWADEARSFSWDTPPLASRMLASAGWSFVVVSYLALQKPVRQRIRLVLLLLFVYLFPLTLVTLLFHLNRFDFAVPITYAFFVIVVLMDVATGWYLLRQPTILSDTAQNQEQTGSFTQLWMLFTAILTGLWGLALFITDSGPVSVIWVWSGDLLSSRLIGVMLLAIATGLFYSFRFRDVAQVMLTTLITYSVGLTVASLWNLLFGKPFPVSYFAVFGIVALVSLFIRVQMGMEKSV
jgi:hypothetical protein